MFPVEGPICSVQKYLQEKKPPKTKLANIFDGQVNGLTFLYYTNVDCCRVQWCDLLHCVNVILPKAKITPETLILGLKK